MSESLSNSFIFRVESDDDVGLFSSSLYEGKKDLAARIKVSSGLSYTRERKPVDRHPNKPFDMKL